MDSKQNPELNNGVPPDADVAAPPDDSQLSWNAWLARNGTFVLMIAAAVGFLAYQFGAEGLWNIAKAALGLGFVVFIHELGHFAVAKWCDVHVETFSVGFGPALPGCSFRKGETLYKLALLPLGGYVKMLGEGSDNEEDEDNPRSFKNKTVGQRMAIISAGVVMNVLLGAVCFVVVYRSGVKLTAGEFGMIDPGSPAWKKGLRSGMVMSRLEDIPNPSFEDMKYEVMLTRKGQQLSFVAARPGMPEQTISVEPRREAYDSAPLIGVMPSLETRLGSERSVVKHKVPLTLGPASAARQLDLRPGDKVVAVTDPSQDQPGQTADLPPGPGGAGTDYGELARRLEGLAGRPVILVVERGDAGRHERLEVPAVGFEPSDLVVGTTDAGPRNTPYDPFRLEPLPKVDLPSRPGTHYSFFELAKRLQQLAGKPMVFQVLRRGAADGPPVQVFVPPAHHQVLGLRLRMGTVAALRDASAAQASDLRVGDQLRAVEIAAENGQRARFIFAGEAKSGETLINPERLSFELRRWVEGRGTVRVKLFVDRREVQGQEEKTVPREVELAWDAQRRFDQELPLGIRSPLSIPELGLAYYVETTVEEVAPDSPAARAGLRKGDVLWEVRFKEQNRTDGKSEWGRWYELWSEDSDSGDKKPEPAWPHVFALLQGKDVEEVEFKVRRGTAEVSVVLAPEKDRSWPQADRGIRFEMATQIQQAESLWAAVQMGVERTHRAIVKIYMSLHSMLTGRVSATKNLSGPIGIATMAYDIAGEDLITFILFLGMISVNLAVVNFLPIPVLDGGHMVFLIYEKLRGKPPSEQVRLAATYAGLFMILSLMAFVIYLDIKRRVTGF